jgi:hypothetical protein
VFRNVNGHTPDCDRGIDTTIVIYLNPTPVFDSISISDTAICNESFVSFNFYNTQEIVPGGIIRYEFITVSSSVTGMKDNTGGPFPQDPFTDTLVNSSDIIQPVEYIFTPVIEDAMRGLLCDRGIITSQTVKVTPTLRDTAIAFEYIGGRNIRCFGENNGRIDLHPYGGYYLGTDPYSFTWEKDGSPLNRDSVSITGLGIGTYTYRVEDVIGCFFDSTIILTQPVQLGVVDSVNDMTCSGSNDGSVYLELEGGTLGYDLHWEGPNAYEKNQHLFDSYRDSSLILPEGLYTIAVTDTNGCALIHQVQVDQGIEVNVGLFPTEYGNYNISCQGLSDGAVNVNASGTGNCNSI